MLFSFFLVSYSPVVELLGFLRTYYKSINFAASFNSLSGCDDFLLSADTIICKNFGPNFFPDKSLGLIWIQTNFFVHFVQLCL